MITEKDPEIGKAAARLLEISEDAETRLRIEFDRRWEADRRVERRDAVKEGVEEGMKRIIDLLKKGVSLEEIERMVPGEHQSL
jgi:hypothetical protein